MSEKISEAARMAQREYARQWRKKNPDKVRETNRRYWEKKALAAERGETVATENI